jgi:hypothetical protein
VFQNWLDVKLSRFSATSPSRWEGMAWYRIPMAYDR